MLLAVERVRIQPASNNTLSWDDKGQSLSDWVRNDREESDRDINDLRFEVVDFLEHRCETGKTDSLEGQI